MAFSENLKTIRTKSLLTRKQMAEKIGVSLSTYTNYEAGNRNPGLELIPKIAVALHVSIDELFNYQPDKLARWPQFFEGQNLGILQENGQYILVDGSSGDTSRHATFTEKELVQLLEYAERLADNSLENAKKGLMSNTIREKLTEKIALLQANNS